MLIPTRLFNGARGRMKSSRNGTNARHLEVDEVILESTSRSVCASGNLFISVQLNESARMTAALSVLLGHW